MIHRFGQKTTEVSQLHARAHTGKEIKSSWFLRVFIRHRRSENSLANTQNSPAKFRSFPERALLFHNNSPVTLYYSPATAILNEIPVFLLAI